MEGDHLLLLLSFMVGTAAVLLPLSCHAAFTNGPQFDLLLSSRASFSRAGTLTLDASDSSSDAYALFALSILMPPTYARSASFAGSTFDFSIDSDFEYGALSLIISPDSNISAKYPHVYPYLAEVSPQPQPGRFAYAINVTHTRDHAQGGSFLFRYAVNDSLLFSGIRSGAREMAAVLQYDGVEKKCRATVGEGKTAPQLADEYVVAMDLGSVLNKSVYVGLFASAGGVFHVSRWSLLLTPPGSISIQGIALLSSGSPTTALASSILLTLLHLLLLLLSSSLLE